MNYEKIFPRDLITRMTHVYELLGDVLPADDLDDWIRGFIGERRPANELRIFEAIAVVYLELVADLELSKSDGEDLYNVLVMGASGFIVRNIEERIPAGVPGYDELVDRWKRAYVAGERP